MGTYRRYLSLTKRQKLLAVLRIIIESITFIVIFGNSLFAICTRVFSDDIWFLLLSFHRIINVMNCVLFSVCGILTCRSYKQFMYNFNAIYSYYEQDLIYKNRVKKIKAAILISGFSVFTILAVLLFLKLTLPKVTYLDINFTYYSIKMAEKYSEIRYLLEHISLYTYITMLHALFKCLNQRVLNIQDTYNMKRVGEVLSTEKVHHDSGNFRLKVKIISSQYKRLLNCSKHLSACFKVQVNIC